MVTIALQCPSEGGFTFYRARGMLPICIRSEYEDKFASCTQGNHSANREGGEVEKVNTLLFPNPATTELQIPLTKDFAGTIEISNSFGQKLKQEQFNENETLKLIQLDYPSGMYICTVYWSNGTKSSKKFLIQLP